MAYKLIAGLLATLILSVGTASASPITFVFAGVVDNDPFGAFDNASFSGTFTFESNMPQVLSTSNSGGFSGTGGVYSTNLAFSGTLDPLVAGPYIADTLNITVNNNFPGSLDEYLVTASSSLNSNLSIEIRLDDFTGTAFSSTSLPLSAPSLAAFNSRRFALFDGTLDSPIEAEGVLRNLQCSVGCMTVPEPSNMLLLSIALGAMRRQRRRPAKVIGGAMHHKH